MTSSTAACFADGSTRAERVLQRTRFGQVSDRRFAAWSATPGSDAGASMAVDRPRRAMRLFEHALRLDRMNTVAMTGLAHTSLLNVCHRRCALHTQPAAARAERP